MRPLIVMATTTYASEQLLECYRINSDQIIYIRQRPPLFVRDEAGSYFTSPICEITLPGLTLFASGVADELEARMRK